VNLIEAKHARHLAGLIRYEFFLQKHSSLFQKSLKLSRFSLARLSKKKSKKESEKISAKDIESW